MLKRSFIIICMTILLLSATVGAADKTVLEEKWEGFIETADLDYAPYEGEVKNDSAIGLDFSNDWERLVYDVVTNNLSINYGVCKNVQVNATFAYELGHLKGLDEFQEKIIQLGAIVKVKLYDQNGVVVAIDGQWANAEGRLTINGDNGGVFHVLAYGTNVYSSFKLNNQFAVHNKIGVLGQSKRMTSGIEFALNKNHLVQAKTMLSFRKLNNIDYTVSAMYKGQLFDHTTYLLGIEKRVDQLDYSPQVPLMITNLIETQVIPTVLIRGSFDVQKTNLYNKSLGIEVEKELGQVTLFGGYSHRFPDVNQVKVSTVKAGLDVKFVKNFELSMRASMITRSNPDITYNHEVQGTVGLSYTI